MINRLSLQIKANKRRLIILLFYKQRNPHSSFEKVIESEKYNM